MNININNSKDNQYTNLPIPILLYSFACTEFDMFMFTSNNEPTGGVLLEAYACRFPIVAANAGGIPEVIVNNETGLLAEVGNPIDFADKVEYLMSNPKLQKEFTKNGYQYLVDNFTKKVIAEKMFNELMAVNEK